jgi:hypothetical protein
MPLTGDTTMQLLMTVHHYAGGTEDHVSTLVKSSAQFARDLLSAGYKGDAWNVADLIDSGIQIYIKQFDVTVKKVD